MSRRTALVLGLVVTALVAVLLVLGGLNERRRAGRMLGFSLNEVEGGLQVATLVPGRPAERAGIAVEDLLVAVDSAPLADREDYDRAADRFQHGLPVQLEVLRDGRRTTLEADPGVPFPWSSVAFNGAATIAYLALALITLLQSYDDRRARLLFAFAAAVALELACPRELVGTPEWGMKVAALMPLLVGLQMGMELQLASHIPELRRWYLSRPWLPRVYYGVGLGLGVAITLVVLGEAAGLALPWSGDAIQTVVDDWGLVTWAAAVVLILSVQLRGSRFPRHRHQVLLVLIGCIPWVLFSVASSIPHLLGGALPNWAYELVQPVALLVYPIAIFVAIFRYHLFDIELVVKRGLVYSLVTLTLVVLLYAAINLAGLVIPEVSVRGGIPMWAASAIMLVIGLLFVPLRNAARHFVDRRLFPERLAMRQSLAELAAQLPALGNLTAIGSHLVRRVSDIFGFSSATLLVADPRSGVLVTLASSVVDVEARFGQSFLLEGSDPGVSMLHRSGRPMSAEQVTPHSAALAQRLAAFDAELALGLSSADTLTGILLLGRKTDSERLAAEELELLTLLAPMVATVLENVRLFESATFESLTGLLRREAILDALEREVQRADRYRRPLTVGMADIDRFKSVNDLHGHLAGDALLKRVAHTLKATLRSSDAIGRYGGEEFLFFLPETDLAGGVSVAEKLRHSVEALRDPVEGAEGMRVTISVGLAELDLSDDLPSVEDVIAAADANLLAAKREGRNRVVPPPAAA